MMAKMSSNCCSSQLSSLSVQEKGSKNKRKFRADPPVSDPNKVVAAILNEGRSYEFSAEKFEIADGHGHPPGTCDFCGSLDEQSGLCKLSLGASTVELGGPSEMGSSRAREELEGDGFLEADWNDMTESQLEELCLSNLEAIFKSAIKTIVAYGYTEENATKAISRSGQCFGPKDTVSNIVDNALGFLANGRDNNPLGEQDIEDYQEVGKFALAELVGVLRMVRPFFGNGDAMWCLLISDMNLSHACSMEPLIMPLEGSSNVTSNPSQSMSKPEPKSTEMSLPSPSKPVSAVPCPSVTQSELETVVDLRNLAKQENSIILSAPLLSNGGTSSSFNPLEKPFSAGMSQSSSGQEKFVSIRKMHPVSSNREYTLRQKSLHSEKNCRGYGPKGTFRTAKISGYMLDKRGKPLTDSTGLSLKSASVKISKSMTMGLELAHENGSASFSTSSSASLGSTAFTLEGRGTISQSLKSNHPPTAPEAEVKPSVSATDSELTLSLPTKNNSLQANMSAEIEPTKSRPPRKTPDKSLSHWLPTDKKDEVIMKLIPRITVLQNQLQEWTEWANQKVMQAARRLSKDKAELKTLRQDKEEVERLKKEKRTLEENTLKKLSEMENALVKASGQVERANAAVCKLEVEKAVLRQEMEAAKVRATESAASCQEASKREKKTLMKFQSWESQKNILLEEIVAERQKFSNLQQELEQAKSFLSQLEARWKQEEKTKHELLTRANSIRKEKEQLEGSAKSKEGAIRLKAEEHLQKYKEDIQKLVDEIAQLRLKTDSSKIAALKRGIDGSYVSRVKDSENVPTWKEIQNSHLSAIGFKEFLSSGGVKRERECVMCLSEEMSVVFLPCAHQVVCKTCNELHEKQGMNDCPSCRSPILRRICVRYARP